MNRSCVETFIDKSNSIHFNKYDYSKVNYLNNKTKKFGRDVGVEVKLFGDRGVI